MVVQVVCLCVCSMKSFRNPGWQRLSHIQSLSSKVTLVSTLRGQKQSRGQREGRGFLVGAFSGPCLISLPSTFHQPRLSPQGIPNCRASWGIGSSCVARKRKGRFWLWQSGLLPYLGVLILSSCPLSTLSFLSQVCNSWQNISEVIPTWQEIVGKYF